jgi:hypothetical protein
LAVVALELTVLVGSMLAVVVVVAWGTKIIFLLRPVARIQLLLAMVELLAALLELPLILPVWY